MPEYFIPSSIKKKSDHIAQMKYDNNYEEPTNEYIINEHSEEDCIKAYNYLNQLKFDYNKKLNRHEYLHIQKLINIILYSNLELSNDTNKEILKILSSESKDFAENNKINITIKHGKAFFTELCRITIKHNSHEFKNIVISFNENTDTVLYKKKSKPRKRSCKKKVNTKKI